MLVHVHSQELQLFCETQVVLLSLLTTQAPPIRILSVGFGGSPGLQFLENPWQSLLIRGWFLHMLSSIAKKTLQREGLLRL